MMNHHYRTSFFCTLLAVLAVLCTVYTIYSPCVSAQDAAPQARQPNRRGPFGGGTLPPGVISSMGRAAITSGYTNSVNPLMLFVAIENNQNPQWREHLGLTESDVRKLRIQRDEVNMALMNKIGSRMEQFKNASTQDLQSLETELVGEFTAIGKKMESAVGPEQLKKARTLTFQAMGGLDSPLLNYDMVSTLDLDDSQKDKAQQILRDMIPERQSQLEAGLALAEKMIAANSHNDPDIQKQLTEEQRALEARIFATSKKLGDQVRGILTEAQLRRANELMANRPSFLGPLPRQLRPETPEGEWKPDDKSWKPGEGAPERVRGPADFPLLNFP